MSDTEFGERTGHVVRGLSEIGFAGGEGHVVRRLSNTAFGEGASHVVRSVSDAEFGKGTSRTVRRVSDAEFGEGAGHVGEGVLLVPVDLVSNGIIHEAELALLLHLFVTLQHGLHPALLRRDTEPVDTVSLSHINILETKAENTS